MREVELHNAFQWDCDECGKENFCRTVPIQIDEEDRKDIAIELGMIEEWDEAIPPSEAFYTQPDTVTCMYCRATFKAMPETHP